MKSNRSHSGNTYFLVTCMFALLTFIFAAFMTVDTLFLSHQKLRTGAEDMSMLATDQMNMHDRTGRINNLLVLSRENAFVVGTSYVKAMETEPALGDLAVLLMNESRDGAALVVSEQKKLSGYTIEEIKRLTLRPSSAVAQPWHFTLPWMESASQTPDCVDVGYVEGVDSNVHVHDGNNDLSAFDSTNAQVNARTGLYIANKALTLPAPNNDLRFTLSSLPAPVKDTVSQARTISPAQFKSLATIVEHGSPTINACQCVPSAVKITQSAYEKNLFGVHEKMQTAEANSSHKEPIQLFVCMVGATNGAGPLPETILATNPTQGAGSK